MATPADDPRDHYERITDAWGHLLGENLHHGYFATGHESLEEATSALNLRMARAAELNADCDVLDVGCGTGGPACFLAERIGCRITAITTSETGLRRAQQRARTRNLTHAIRFEHRDRSGDSDARCALRLRVDSVICPSGASQGPALPGICARPQTGGQARPV